VFYTALVGLADPIIPRTAGRRAGFRP